MHVGGCLQRSEGHRRIVIKGWQKFNGNKCRNCYIDLAGNCPLGVPAMRAKNPAWLSAQGITVPSDCVYLAPMYGAVIEDSALVKRIRQTGIRHVVVTIGGGTQERLGFYLKEQLNYLAGVSCIGAAIAFLSGDQVFIPEWADRFYLDWLFAAFLHRVATSHVIGPPGNLCHCFGVSEANCRPRPPSLFTLTGRANR